MATEDFLSTPIWDTCELTDISDRHSLFFQYNLLYFYMLFSVRDLDGPSGCSSSVHFACFNYLAQVITEDYSGLASSYVSTKCLRYLWQIFLEVFDDNSDFRSISLLIGLDSDIVQGRKRNPLGNKKLCLELQRVVRDKGLQPGLFK